MIEDPSILYVEDDPNSRKVMRMLLKGRMKLSNVVLFEDSENFVERVKALDPRPDIVFLDIHVKPHSGFEMLNLLHNLPEYENVPVVALTASVMNEEVHTLKVAGFSSCLAKPVDADTFPELMNRILEGEIIWRII